MLESTMALSIGLGNRPRDTTRPRQTPKLRRLARNCGRTPLPKARTTSVPTRNRALTREFASNNAATEPGVSRAQLTCVRPHLPLRTADRNLQRAPRYFLRRTEPQHARRRATQRRRPSARPRLLAELATHQQDHDRQQDRTAAEQQRHRQTIGVTRRRKHFRIAANGPFAGLRGSIGAFGIHRCRLRRSRRLRCRFPARLGLRRWPQHRSASPARSQLRTGCADAAPARRLDDRVQRLADFDLGRDAVEEAADHLARVAPSCRSNLMSNATGVLVADLDAFRAHRHRHLEDRRVVVDGAAEVGAAPACPSDRGVRRQRRRSRTGATFRPCCTTSHRRRATPSRSVPFNAARRSSSPPTAPGNSFAGLTGRRGTMQYCAAPRRLPRSSRSSGVMLANSSFATAPSPRAGRTRLSAMRSS